MKKTINIKINIGGKFFPMQVPIEDEEMIRKVGKNIEDQIANFQKNYNTTNMQDVLSLCAITLGIEAEKNKEKLNLAKKDIENKLNALDKILSEE